MSAGSKDNKKLPIPQFVGSVWEACSALKKTPTSNSMAIGRAMTRVAVSVKDVLREMNELESMPAAMNADQEIGSVTDRTIMVPESCEDDDSSRDDIGNDLSADEMMIARLAINIISATLTAIKELIRFISSLLKLPSDPTSYDVVEHLEELLEICDSIGCNVDELGACVYPPQEVSLMKTTAEALSANVEKIKMRVLRLEASAESLFQACKSVEITVTELVSEVSHVSVGVEDKLQTLSISVSTS